MKNLPEKLLFLDVDGVLNTRPGSLDEDRLERLAQIIRKTDCRVVLSSAWRLNDRQLLRIETEFAKYSGGQSFYGETPDLSKVAEGKFSSAQLKAVEIASYCLGAGFESNKVKIVILDDERPERSKFDWLKTDPAQGLTPEIAEEAIRILND